MKYIKLLLCFCFVVFLASCSEDETMNTGETTVSFAKAEVSVKENAGMLNIPIQVSGDQNGLIRMSLAIETAQGTVEDENFIVTSKELLIPTDTKSVNCEIRILDDGDVENDDRVVTVKIGNIEGAKVGNVSTCVVTILDVDKNPYYKLMGDWVFSGYDLTSDSDDPVTFNVNISGGSTTEEQEANAEKRFVCTGFSDGATPNQEITWKMEYDAATKTLSVVEGDKYAEYNFTGLGKAALAIIPMAISGGDLIPEASVAGSWNEQFNEISFSPNGVIGIGLFQGSSYVGWFGAYIECSMKKK